MTSVIHLGIAATAAFSCGWDVWTRRIPNALTLTSALAGCAVHALDSGVEGTAFSAAGWATGLALFLPWFLAGGMGGGDVKLLAAFGAWLGPAQTAVACLYAMLAGGVVALAAAARRRRLKAAITSTVHLALGLVSSTAGGERGQIGPRDGRQERIAYAVPVAIGVWCSIWFR